MKIKDILPHREPFLFVDKIIEAKEDKIIAEYTYKENEPFFKGHFPNNPIVPGVLLIEAMAQAGGCGLYDLNILNPNDLFVLASIEKVKFRDIVKPLDTIRMEIENLRVSKLGIKQSGKVFVKDKLCCEATWLCLVKRSK